MDRSTEVTEVELRAEQGPDRGRQFRVMGGALALVAALLVGALLATSDDTDTVDVTSDVTSSQDADVADETPSDPDADTIDGEATEDADRDLPASSDEDDTTAARGEDSLVEFESEADAAYYGGSDSAIFDGSRFISIGYSEFGQTLRVSEDGVTWEETALAGLPENSNIYQLAEHDGTVIAVVEQWNEPDFDGDDIAEFFGPNEGPKHFLASSTNLTSWDLVELPAPTGDDGPVFLSVNGIALNDAGAVLLTQAHREGGNELRLLYDAGIIDADGLGRYCGIDFGEGEVFHVQLCDYADDEQFWADFEAAMEAATTDEERRAIELEFEQNFVEPEPEVIATISPGDPLHAELNAIYNVEPPAPTTTVLTGPVTGPFTQTDLDAEGYPAGLVEADGTFVTILQQWSRVGPPTTTVLTSLDGQVWDDVGSLPNGDVGQLFAIGSNLLVLGGDEEGQPLSLLSTDLGASWSSADVTTTLYGAYPQAVGGPAGIAVVMQGSTEPYPEWTPPPPLVIERDGFVLTITYGDEDGLVTLHDADGNLVHSLREYEMYEGEQNDVVRMSRLTGLPTFLDPETGEDLVSFTQDDYQDAYSEFDDEPVEEIAFATEVLFSADGESFTTLEDPRLDVDNTRGNLQLVAVGDDEVIFAIHTWVEPPDELFAFEREGREPTEAEGQALDAWFRDNGGENAIEYIRVEVA